MNQEIIAKAGKIIDAKTGYVGGGMEGYAALSLIDENGYPATSTLTIAKADGINWITFCSSSGRNSVERAKKCNRASVCINSSEYNITLTGTIEVLTDLDTKKDNWFPVMDDGAHWSGPDDPNFCVLRFATERYSIFITDGEGYKDVEGTLEGAKKKTIPLIEPMFNFDRQCEQAIELYKKAFGAELTYLGRYSDVGPESRPQKYNDEKDSNLVYHAQMTIGNQNILLCDNLFNDLPRGHSVYPVTTLKTADEVKAVYSILADGAIIITPPTKELYSECVASLIDKFGIYWELMAR